MRIVRSLIRPAADLAALATYQTPAVDIIGAIACGFFAKATNATQLSAQSFEVAPDILDATQTWYAPASHGGFATVGNISGVTLNNGGYTAHLHPATAYKGSLWRSARINITGHATLVVSGLEIWAILMFPPGVQVLENAQPSLVQ